ncbi:hypothetical protein P1X14_14145 [Sphingomonas sp. AOB5]|uniref:hypothetical protein n=1 Tax=Sphingomonas sp. AOB5 TaxID=3034017 RepID=UPI0023F70BD3|nr:hypothetical protein [Sphingomonas sp. AOB5]MDF7776391.1 hypothetical protein [Sphingomonas sp. AOB5]
MSEAETLATKLRSQTSIDDPFTGPVAPAEVEARSRAWPTSDEWASVRLVAVTEGDGRRIEEYAYTPAEGGQEQPVGIVFLERDGQPHARLYAQHQWIEDRGPILPVDETLVPSREPGDIIARYFPTIASADLEATLDLWEADGYLQHSNGDTFQGRERLREDFTKFFQTGGIKLKYCNMADDGRICALEAYMPSGRPALAVYERGATGKMAAARLYL